MSISNDGYLFRSATGLNKKIITVIILFLMAFAAVVAPLAVYAQNTNLGVSIVLVNPKEETGPAGTQVNLQGTIYVSNGSYQVVLGKNVVDSGTADGYYVNSNFTVPQAYAGTYPLTLRDVGINVNSTQEFTVTTGYSITAVPSALQENNTVSLTVSITGCQLGTSYAADVDVVAPSPLSTSFTKTIALGTPNGQGTASAQVTFPDSSFQPSGSLTNYAGTYAVNFNQTLSPNLVHSKLYRFNNLP